METYSKGANGAVSGKAGTIGQPILEDLGVLKLGFGLSPPVF
ncbi:hypothetical protein QFZ20_001806 [Flavobacterium sp. W4I14]|nr:hypothetical protein [Flavobacterium sp. W4I14]